MAQTEQRSQVPSLRQDRVYLKVAWVLLLILALFPVLAPVADLVGIGRTGLPSDHAAAFAALSGMTWSAVKGSAPGITNYITLLEQGYALHELVFGILFLVIVAIPFRRGETWAWWACWVVLVADIGYSATFGRHDPTLLRQSLIAVIALPVVLLIQVRRFFGTRPQR